MMLRNKFLLISLSGLVLLFAFCAIGQTQEQGSNVGYDTLPPQVEWDVLGKQVMLFNINESASAPPGVDVNVSNLVGNEAEVSIDVNPTNPNNQVIVGHAPRTFITRPDSTITWGRATMNTFYTIDGGLTWTSVKLGNAQDGLTSTVRFDPTVAFDNNGNVYVGYGVKTVDAMENVQTTVVVAKSTNGGQTYTTITQVHTGLHPGFIIPANDKWHLATGPDPFIPAQQNVYITWTNNVPETGTDQRIVVSVSTDGGTTFSAPVIINDLSIAGTSQNNLFADPAVGPNGELYVAWENTSNGGVFVDVSFDGGVTFGTDILVNSGTGFMTIPAQPDRGVHVGPTIDVDRSGNLFNGRLYVTYTDVGTGGLPDTDIFVRSSINNGSTWTAPILVNDDGGTKSQFLPWLDVDQQTGVVAVVWYDARNDSNNQLAEVFMAVSDNGGVSFLPNILVSDGQSDQSTNNPNRWSENYLEYIGIAIFGCEAFPVWSDNSTNPADLDFFTDQVQITGLDTPICNQPPDCNAGGPYTGECSVTLDGTGSSDPEGSALTYSWTTNCPGGSFDDVDSAMPVLTVSSPCNINCNVTLTVTDIGGLTSQCSVEVIVTDEPLPKIYANGSGGTVNTNEGDPLSIAIGLSSGSFSGTIADWWIIVSTSSGWEYFDLTQGDFTPGLSPTIRFPLVDFGSTVIFNTSGSGAGTTYTYYFAVDLGGGQLFFDFVVVNISP